MTGQAIFMALLTRLHERGVIDREELVSILERAHKSLEAIFTETGTATMAEARDLVGVYLVQWRGH